MPTMNEKRKFRSFEIPKPEYLGSINTQNLMRIKVNRVSLLQVLRVGDVLDYLECHKVLKNKEIDLILSGKSRQEQARWLIDILAFKSERTAWYKHFHNALALCNVKPEIRQKYNGLIGFLDNTIIRRPIKFVRSPSISNIDKDLPVANIEFPRYSPLPNINSKADKNASWEVAEVKMNDTDYKQVTIRGYVDFMVDAPTESKVVCPHDFFNSLKSSDEPADLLQLNEEYKAYEKIKKLEITYHAYISGKIPDGFVLSMAEAVHDLFVDRDNLFMYVKYFNQMKLRYLIEPVKELVDSFHIYVTKLLSTKDGEVKESILKFGFSIFELLQEYGNLSGAQLVMDILLRYLGSNRCLDTLMVTYEASVKLARIRNRNQSYEAAHIALKIAHQVKHEIELMSFGQDILDTSGYETEMSYMMQKMGNHISGYDWAHSSLKNAKCQNKQSLVDLLCTAAHAYMHRLQLKKAKMLAVHAVQQAKKIVGMNHPTFVRALLSYLDYSNNFIKDREAVVIAEKIVALVRKVYGAVKSGNEDLKDDNPHEGETVLVAHAHLALSKALLATNEDNQDLCIKHAYKAYQIAVNCLDPFHSSLANFRENLVNCLLKKAGDMKLSPEERRMALVIAETEIKSSLILRISHYGEISWKCGMSKLILAEIYEKTNRNEEAEELYLDVLGKFMLCLSQSSHYFKFAESKVGIFFLKTNRPQDAIKLLERVVDRTDTGGAYLKWFHIAYQSLLDSYKITEKSSHYNTYLSKMNEWLDKTQMLTSASWYELNLNPINYEEFLVDFDELRGKFQSAKDEIFRNLADI